MTLRVIVVAEDRMGMALARDLCDRVVSERARATWLKDQWEDPSLREQCRSWAGFDRAESFTSWSGLKAEASRLRAVAHGLGLRGPAAEAYKAARVAQLQSPERKPDLLVLARDTQGDVDARAEMVRGGLRANPGVPMLHAIAHQESEAWAVAGFEARDGRERSKLTLERIRLGFDPSLAPHALTPNNPSDPRDAKRVCKNLGLGDHHDPRTIACWTETPLPVLRRNGEAAGLAAYLDEVEAVVLPLLGDVPPR
ncbi:MAG: hypothetical protein IPF99_22720 [Deltaproteobacteria bacterium]|nr:hypothetical protein [Deltaproteobacteria bacterium]